MRGTVILLLVSMVVFLGCKSEPKTEKQQSPAITKVPVLAVSSPAFANGDTIPSKYTCIQEDLSPALEWGTLPEGTRSVALICDDPDAPLGTWIHWVVWAIPPTSTGLKEALPKVPELPDGTRQGVNDFGKIGYSGPCPPRGKPHRYFFRVYALDFVPDLPPGATRSDLLSAIDGHVLARGELMGTLAR